MGFGRCRAMLYEYLCFGIGLLHCRESGELKRAGAFGDSANLETLR